VELIRPNLERHPDKVAYFCEERAITYAELDRASRYFAFLLESRGIAAGERVVIALPDCFAFPVAFLGCLLAGAVAVAAGSSLTDDDLVHVTNDSGATLLVSHEEHASRHASLCRGVGQIVCDDHGPVGEGFAADGGLTPYHPSTDDFAYMLYTSGSTGRPKGIPHYHGSLLLPCYLMGKGVLGITGDDVIFSTSKLSFCYGLLNSLSFPLFFGATAILLPGKPDVPSILRTIQRRSPTIFFSVPTVFRQIILSCAEPELRLPMRLCCSAGEALPPILFHEWRRLTGMEIIDGIGASELSHHFICNPPGRAVPGSAGKAVPGYRIRLVNDADNDVPSGCEGNLLVSGATRAPFYWNLPELSRVTMRSDGFTRTGDIFMEKDGYYYHRGRSDDMIKVDAQWVSPVMVEDVLRSHPAVADCAVAAVTVGALVRPGAFVILSAGREPSPELVRELKEHVISRLPNHMCPARFRFLADLPRTSTGKVRRCCLREQA
jgi:benzoate-CoA ligase